MPDSTRSTTFAPLPLLLLMGAPLAGGALVPAPAGAVLLKVGPGGDFATIQAALTQAQASEGPDEIRVRTGIYAENVVTGLLVAGNDLLLSGGWDATFTTRTLNPSATVLDANSVGRAIAVGDIFADVTVRGLSFIEGRVASAGAGMIVSVRDNGRVRIESCQFLSNTVASPDSGFGGTGGGLFVSAAENGRVEIVGNHFSGNAAGIVAATGTVSGGAAAITLTGSATAVLLRSYIGAHTLSGGSLHTGAALYAVTEDDSRLDLGDVDLYSNHGGAGTVGSGIALVAKGSSTIDARRIYLAENRLGDDGSTQVSLLAEDTAHLRFSDAVVAESNDGIAAEATSSAVLRLINLTVTRHVGTGLAVLASAPASAAIANTIAWLNDGGDTALIGNGLTQQANLYGVDPLFVDGPGGDYRLSPGSPALDSGTATPVGGLSHLDTIHRPRRAGSLPDKGAYERNGITADDFESGDLYWWPGAVPGDS